MRKYFTLALLSLVLQLPVGAQVRPEYLYNTAMPYGTLDIRTKISATTFYYLDEGKTFSYREKAPGVKTESFVDMTSWDSSPYKQGNLRKKDGTKDSFIMNYRLLAPLGYNASYEKGYPLIVIMHGAIERGNCYYSNCYHANWQYDPNVNSPPAPTDPGHQLLNNDAQLVTGGKEHLDARNRAGSRLPDDPSMPSNAFPGFVLMPQMLNVWDSLVVEDVIRIVRLHCEKYNIDPNRIYIHGLSIGGYATYEAIKRAPWLFAAALPMSAVTEAANIFRNGLQDKVAHIPLWIFQGAGDTRPSPAQTESLIAKFKSAGALIRYTKYANVGHRTWEKAYYEPDFFSWMLGNSKTNLHVRAGITAIDASKNVYPVLMLAAGFFAYQWEKDGVVMQGAASNNLTVKSPGIYRARFSRVANPGANDWEPWSSPVTITGDPPQDPADNDGTVDNGGTDDGGTNTGGTDDGGTNTGGTDDGGTNTGGTDDGGTNTGGTDDGGTNTGGTDDGGTNTGGTDDGGTNTGGTDDGGTNTGGTDDGGTNTGGTDNGGTNTGGTDDGGTNTGGTDDGGTNTGGTDDGGTNTGGTDDGGTNTGGTDDGGTNTGGTDDGGTNTGGTDDGGTNTGGTDDGGTNTGGTDDGGTNTGGTDDGGTNTGGTDDGGTNTGGTDDGGTNTGGTDDGGTNTGGTDDGGTNTGGTDDGGTNTGGTDDGGTNTGGNDDGGTNTGGVDDGGTNTGGADDGGTNTGGVDDGGTNTGGADDGGTNTGGTDDGGTNTGGVDDGGTNTGGTDDGGTNTGGTNDGGANPGTIDHGVGGNTDNPTEPGSDPVVTAVENPGAFPISVYPNPTDGRNINIHLSSFDTQDLDVTLVDMLGHVLHRSQYSAREVSSGDISIPLALDNGMYILIIRNARQETRARVIVR